VVVVDVLNLCDVRIQIGAKPLAAQHQLTERFTLLENLLDFGERFLAEALKFTLGTNAVFEVLQLFLILYQTQQTLVFALPNQLFDQRLKLNLQTLSEHLNQK
jgi:hypothetical protein